MRPLSAPLIRCGRAPSFDCVPHYLCLRSSIPLIAPLIRYEICDEVGLYVMDEANIETHGLVSLPAPSNKLHLNASPEWRRALLARVTRMVESQKNHACIFMWSLGNESGVGPTHLLMRQWINARDPTRPSHYEGLGNCHNGASEVMALRWPRHRPLMPSGGPNLSSEPR